MGKANLEGIRLIRRPFLLMQLLNLEIYLYSLLSRILLVSVQNKLIAPPPYVKYQLNVNQERCVYENTTSLLSSKINVYVQS